MSLHMGHKSVFGDSFNCHSEFQKAVERVHIVFKGATIGSLRDPECVTGMFPKASQGVP